MESAVKNAATAEESWLTSNSAYTTNTGSLATDEGLKYAGDVTLTIAVDTGRGYCIKAEHSSLTGEDVWYHSAVGAPKDVIPTATAPTCPAA